jgi:predicted RecA/RadA family phage recombinase
MKLQLRSDSGQVFQTRFAATAATVAKVPFVENGKAFIPLNSAGAGESNEHVFQSEVSDAPKASGEAWAVGAKLYWNDTTKAFTTTAAGAVLCGYAVQPAQAAATVSPIFLFNSFAA